MSERSGVGFSRPETRHGFCTPLISEEPLFTDFSATCKTSTNAVVKTITGLGGGNPWAVAVTSNGRYVYVTNAGSGTVNVIKTSTNRW